MKFDDRTRNDASSSHGAATPCSTSANAKHTASPGSAKVPIDAASEAAFGDFTLRDEHASVTVQDACNRPRPAAHVIVFANEKGGVGKSTLAFHSCMALSHMGASVLAIDLDRRQQTLHRALETRDATARALQVELPRPRHMVLEKHSIAQLVQEMNRQGNDCDFIIIDIAGHDSPLARRAIAMADTLVTPVNNSFADLDPLAWFSAVSRRFNRPGPFAAMIKGLREERVRRGFPALDWVVVKNRVRGCEQRLQAKIDKTLCSLSDHLNFRIAQGVSERVAYRELLPFGLTHRDLRFIPKVGRLRPRNGDEIARLVRELNLPKTLFSKSNAIQRPGARLSKRGASNFRETLDTHLGPVPADAS